MAILTITVTGVLQWEQWKTDWLEDWLSSHRMIKYWCPAIQQVWSYKLEWTIRQISTMDYFDNEVRICQDANGNPCLPEQADTSTVVQCETTPQFGEDSRMCVVITSFDGKREINENQLRYSVNSSIQNVECIEV